MYYWNAVNYVLCVKSSDGSIKWRTGDCILVLVLIYMMHQKTLTIVHSVSYQLIRRKINLIFLAVKIPYRTHSAVNTVSTIHRIMRWCNIPAKQTDDVIITTSIILQEINHQNSHHLSFLHRL